MFGQIDDLMADDTIVASSSSCLTASMFAEDFKHRQNMLVAHPVCIVFWFFSQGYCIWPLSDLTWFFFNFILRRNSNLRCYIVLFWTSDNIVITCLFLGYHSVTVWCSKVFRYLYNKIHSWLSVSCTFYFKINEIWHIIYTICI